MFFTESKVPAPPGQRVLQANAGKPRWKWARTDSKGPLGVKVLLDHLGNPVRDMEPPAELMSSGLECRESSLATTSLTATAAKGMDPPELKPQRGGKATGEPAVLGSRCEEGPLIALI